MQPLEPYNFASNLNYLIQENWHTNESTGEEWLYLFMKEISIYLYQVENQSLSKKIFLINTM